MQKITQFSLFLLASILVHSVFGQETNPDPARFAQEIQAFSQWDKKNATPQKPVVFVGSSSIRFWNTGERFPDLPVINRGFGGSHISDVIAYIDETVLRYKPKVVIFYAGDNDIYDGKSNAQVLEDYTQFVDLVHASNPAAVIVFIPIKPSLARWALWPQMNAANALVHQYSKKSSLLQYVDLASIVLGTDGHPRPEFFVEDGLHLNSTGYDAWSSALKIFLETPK